MRFYNAVPSASHIFFISRSFVLFIPFLARTLRHVPQSTHNTYSPIYYIYQENDRKNKIHAPAPPLAYLLSHTLGVYHTAIRLNYIESI